MKIHEIPLPVASALKLKEDFNFHGALLLRGKLLDLQSFESLTREFSDNFHDVGTRLALTLSSGDGFTTEVFHKNFMLLGHSEGTYRPYPKPPDVCFFMCITPPQPEGGETTIINGTAMLESIPNRLRMKLENEGVIYESLWSRSRWSAEFGVNTVEELVELLDKFTSIDFEMLSDQLRIFYKTQAITFGRDGRPVFANAILAHLPSIPKERHSDMVVYANPTNKVYFGNGTPLDNQDVINLIDAHDKNIINHRWEQGDILIIDNTRCMHGRQMTKFDCERVIISRCCKLPD